MKFPDTGRSNENSWQKKKLKFISINKNLFKTVNERLWVSQTREFTKGVSSSADSESYVYYCCVCLFCKFLRVICKRQKPKNYEPVWNYKLSRCEENLVVIQREGKRKFVIKCLRGGKAKRNLKLGINEKNFVRWKTSWSFDNGSQNFTVEEVRKNTFPFR